MQKVTREIVDWLRSRSKSFEIFNPSADYP